MNQKNIAVFGLGSMGMGIARSCVRAGLKTFGFDTNADAVRNFTNLGGEADTDINLIAGDLDIVIIVVVNANQMSSIMTDSPGLISKLKPGSVVMGCPTVTPEYAKTIEIKLESRDILYLDSPISGGSAKASQGALTIMASGKQRAFDAARPALDAISETVYDLGDHAGPGSAMKVVNQLLAGVHIAAAAEAMTFGIRQGIDASKILDVISNCAGTSWMFENRGKHIVDGDYSPHSSVEIFVKDLGIVNDIARASRSYTPLASAALQEFLAASGSGIGHEDDSAVAKVYARNSNVKLPGQ
jgi:3-hydroxyisobutyrate dehydrogenase-like beta-hydroxyacid dehydrogenase